MPTTRMLADHEEYQNARYEMYADHPTEVARSMISFRTYKSFMCFDSSTQFTPTLIGSAILRHINYNCCKVSVYQAKLEAKEYFSLIREWNRSQADPPQGSLEPELLLIKEMALT